jgi:glycosyltransferase involved in cell wall biosynthesis
MLREKIPNLYLVVAGEFWENKKSYQQKIEELGLSMRVHLEDRYIPDDEVGIFFRAADLAVAPYIGGTQSAVSAMAMGFGTPLVATKWSAAGINENNAGMIYMVPAGDAYSLAEAIQAFFENNPSFNLPQSSSSSSSWETIVKTIEMLQNSTNDE